MISVNIWFVDLYHTSHIWGRIFSDTRASGGSVRSPGGSDTVHLAWWPCVSTAYQSHSISSFIYWKDTFLCAGVYVQRCMCVHMSRVWKPEATVRCPSWDAALVFWGRVSQWDRLDDCARLAGEGAPGMPTSLPSQVHTTIPSPFPFVLWHGFWRSNLGSVLLWQTLHQWSRLPSPFPF